MSESARRLSIGRRAAVAVAASVAVAVVSAGPVVAPPQASAQDAGLETLGELPIPPCETAVPGEFFMIPVAVDADARLLYVKYTCAGDQLAVYDLSTEIPTFVMAGPAFETSVRTWNSNTVQFAKDRDRIFVLGLSPLSEGENTQIEVIDRQSLERIDTWKMTEKVPGFAAMAFNYDADRDRIYLVGTFEGGNLARVAGGVVLGPGAVPRSAIVAIDAESGEFIWVNPLRSCDTPLNTQKQGAVLAMSAVRPMLYAFCVGGAPGHQSVGQGGAIRLDVSEQEGETGVVDFASEFFPVSGAYSENLSTDGGVVALDRHHERLVAQSLSDRTHGAWVFDGERGSWLGFVAAPDNTNSYYGLDPATGKHYMGGGSHGAGIGYINITDARATPVPQGPLFDEIRSATPWARDVEGSLAIRSNMLVDPPTGRLFASYIQGPARGVLVMRDSTPAITPRTPLDLDELTHELPDDEARLEFSANTSGFGAQYVQVGGWENVWSRAGGTAFGNFNGEDNPANIRFGNRGARTAFVDSVGIASSGSSATAIATQPDDNTPADAETKTRDVTEQLPDDDDEGETDEVSRVTCLDGTGEPLTTEDGSKEEPAHAVVTCDLENLETTGHVRFSGGSGGGGVVVSDSSFDGRTFRDPDRGIATETEAVAEGIFFGEADVGGFSIDRVTSTATTRAKGLDGESHVRWVRTVEGMRTIAADGTAGEPTSCTTIVESGKERVEEGDVDCSSLQKELNELIPNRFEVKFPTPEIVATPGGAFASVQENEADFLNGKATNNDQLRAVPGMEMTVFADGDQRGRLWVQLAAVKADATFIRSPIQGFEPFGSPTGGSDTATIGEDSTSAPPATDDGEAGAHEVPDSGGTVQAPALTPEAPDVADDENTIVVASHQERLVGGFGWLPALRSFGDAVLAGALYLVFLLPIAEIVRRRRLLDVLTDAGSADESSLSAQRSPARAIGSPVSVSGSPVGSKS